jgi:hypothetical protein
MALRFVEQALKAMPAVEQPQKLVSSGDVRRQTPAETSRGPPAQMKATDASKLGAKVAAKTGNGRKPSLWSLSGKLPEVSKQGPTQRF